MQPTRATAPRVAICSQHLPRENQPVRSVRGRLSVFRQSNSFDELGASPRSLAPQRRGLVAIGDGEVSPAGGDDRAIAARQGGAPRFAVQKGLAGGLRLPVLTWSASSYRAVKLSNHYCRRDFLKCRRANRPLVAKGACADGQDNDTRTSEGDRRLDCERGGRPRVRALWHKERGRTCRAHARAQAAGRAGGSRSKRQPAAGPNWCRLVCSPVWARLKAGKERRCGTARVARCG
jgi:hypothetical protein